ncbi:MAG TPA: hypothetical protein VF605_12510 [Allosphingosinicella sp.]
MKKLEGLKSVYIAGTRGSGKTSLLMAVNWKERLYNPTVRDQVGYDQPPFIAVYFRLPDYLSSAIGLIDWAHTFPESQTSSFIGYEVFSQLMESVAAQLICEAFSSLRAAGTFRYTPEQEDEAVAGMLSEYPLLLSLSQGKPPRDLADLAYIFKRVHQRINSLLTRGLVRDALVLSLEAQPGVFINDLVSRIRALACAEEGVCSPDFHVKICIDDCETLQPLQQRFLNSLVRSSRHPLFWVVSFVSVDYDSTATIYPSQTLSDADRTQIILDDMEEPEFARFCQAVSRLRVYYSDSDLSSSGSLRDLSEDFFNLRAVLGHYPPNKLIAEAAKGSISAEFEEFFARALAQRGPKSELAPIYETYIQEKLGERLVDDRPKNRSAYLRRKYVAALLAICSEYGFKTPYAGMNTVVFMGNRCIRDYLEIVGSIVDEGHRVGEIRGIKHLQYRKRPITIRTQTAGISRSSRAKLDGIRNNMEQDWAEATRVVEFLGKLTARLQANHTSQATLATPERGNFIFDLAEVEATDWFEAEARRAMVLKLLRRCEADGLLRPASTISGDEGDGGDLTLHVHRRFAAEFGFSFRGPYGSLRMPMVEFTSVCEGRTDLSVDDLVERAYAKISRNPPRDLPRLI